MTARSDTEHSTVVDAREIDGEPFGPITSALEDLDLVDEDRRD